MLPSVAFDEVLQLLHTYGHIIGQNVFDQNFKITPKIFVIFGSIIAQFLSLSYTILAYDLIAGLKTLPILAVVAQVNINSNKTFAKPYMGLIKTLN